MTFSGPILHIAFNGGWYLLNDLATYWELAIWFLLPNDLQYTFTLALDMLRIRFVQQVIHLLDYKTFKNLKVLDIWYKMRRLFMIHQHTTHTTQATVLVFSCILYC